MFQGMHYVYEVYKEMSFSKAARNLFISQPSLSAAVKKAEKQIGFPIFDRSSNHIQLTDRLFSGSLDLLIDNKNMDPAVYQKSFFCEEHLLLAVPIRLAVNEKMKNYALTASDIRENRHLNSRIPPVPLENFQNESFLLLKSGNDTRSRADRICHNAHVLPKIKLELDQQITAYNLSRYGMGISFCSDTLVRHVPDDEGLVYYKLDHKDALREVNFYYKRGRYMPRVVSTFLEMI